MNPVLKYLLARVGIFAVLAIPLAFLMNLLLAMATALLVSMAVSYFVLKDSREAMVNHIDEGMKRRQEEKEKLRAELNGD
ncbi:DUF4229 domain-containing protein [Natronoglycomyces albus]|uniref:DUF4229 domain-containing protein n=1 Tax=Natronoglycomyces albus TaxID=2811108 RepID=A0A895XT51_9ACTN|nr:DUF4229 domain-containing protein [Natronoglycomyces albus]QSB05716.1 DUF4229 domain-containing protein [Natronoglycomyces albus]